MRRFSRQQWEDHLKKWEIGAVHRQPFRGRSLLIAEGERSPLSSKVVADMMLHQQELRDLPGGYYKLVWAIDYDEYVEVGGAAFFERGHDPEIPADMRQKARIETMLRQAEAWLDAEAEAMTVH